MDYLRHCKLNQFKALPVSVGFNRMISTTPRCDYIKPGAIGALTEYTSAMFRYTPSSTHKYFILANRLIATRGKVNACKTLKELYRVSSLLACGLPYTVSHESMWIATDPDGFPKSLRGFKDKLTNGSLDEKRS